MLPISIAGSMRISAPLGSVSPASTARTSAQVASKSRPRLHAAQVDVRLVAAGHEAAKAP